MLDFGRRRGAQFLRLLLTASISTDDAIAQSIRDAGGNCCRSMVAKLRAGDRTFTLDHFFAVLNHLDLAERRHILDKMLEPFGLRTLPVEVGTSSETEWSNLALEVSALAGDLARVVHDFTHPDSDGGRSITRKELDRLQEALQPLRQVLADADAATRRAQ